MPTTWLGDDFRISGNLIGTSPAAKEAAVGSWANPHAANASYARSGSGGVITCLNPFSTFDIQILDGTTSVSSGITTIEAAIYGPVEIRFLATANLNGFGNAAAMLRILGAGAGNADTFWSAGFSYGVTANGWSNGTLTGVPCLSSTRNVIRLEITTGVDCKVYFNNSLLYTSPAFVGTGSAPPTGYMWPSGSYTIAGLRIIYNANSTDLNNVNDTMTILDYVNVVRGATAGPLGSPFATQGGAISLPHTLSVVGAQYGHGQAEVELPMLYLPAQIDPPRFWLRRSGVREVS